MAASFSVGVDADPMLVEATIDKTLDEIIKERRTKDRGEKGKEQRHRVRGLCVGSLFLHCFGVVLFVHDTIGPRALYPLKRHLSYSTTRLRRMRVTRVGELFRYKPDIIPLRTRCFYSGRALSCADCSNPRTKARVLCFFFE